MGFSTIGSTYADVNRILKIMGYLTSPNENEARNAASVLKREVVDKRRLGFDGIRVYRSYFRIQSQFDQMCALAEKYWTQLGFLPKREPEPIPQWGHNPDWRYNPNIHLNYHIWINAYSYTRKTGRVVHVRDHWRGKPVRKTAEMAA